MGFLIAAFCIVCAASAVGLFWAYRRGLKDGMRIMRPELPVPVEPVQPLATLKETISFGEMKSEIDSKIEEGLSNLLAHDPFKVKFE